MKSEHLPEGWRWISLGDVALISPENLRSDTLADYEIEYVDIGSVENGNFTTKSLRFSEASSRARRIIRDNDILISTVRPYLRAFTFVRHAKPNLIASTGFAVIRATGVDPDYLYQVVYSDSFVSHLCSFMVGSNYPAVNESDIPTIRIPLPPIDEQRRIAEVLRDADANIVRVEAQIEVAQAVKRGVMQRLFTYGLAGEGAPTKQTKIGEIPAAWEIVQLGQLLHSIEAGRSPQALDRPAEDDEWGVLKVSALRPEGLQAHENKAVVDPQHINSVYEIHEGDVLISRANTFELVGLVTFVENTPPLLMLSDKTLRLVINRNLSDSRFLSYFLQSDPMRQQIVDNATGTSAGMKNITQDSILRLWVAYSDLGEQREIAAILSDHDATIRNLQAEAASLREVKRGLMQGLLSGEVRV